MAQDTLARIARDVEACTKCPLHETRTRGVPGEGNPDAEVLFIGEAPGFNEDKQGRPFVGPAGRLLNEMLEHIGMERKDVFITNVVRSRPPGNRDPEAPELAACDEYTQRQLAVIQPLLIVTLGRFSMARFFGNRVRITQVHGTTTVWEGITCIAMFHPAAVLRAQTSAMRQAYAEDFEKIPPLLERLRKQPPKSAEPEADDPPAPPPDQLKLF
jgi:DNA polymerase